MLACAFSCIRRSLFLLSLSCLAAAQISVLTQRYDSSRDGLNANETTLTTSNVNSSTFGKLFSLPVDGRLFAQPLYVPNLSIPGNGLHNVVFVATEHDSVYAYDADGLQAQPLWEINLATSSCPSGFTCTSVPYTVTGITDTVPEIGITGTPVIDASTGTLYAVAKTQEISGSTKNYVYRLHALNITTGTEEMPPVVIQGQVAGSGSPNNGSGSLLFSPLYSTQRPGLSLVNNTVYIAFGSWGDDSSWHGWVFGYSESSLAQTAVFSVTPNGNEGEGGIWMHGNGIAADANGYLYISTGNGGFDGLTDYSDSFLKLSTPGLTVSDYFTPFNQAILDAGDLDIASGGLMLLPDSAGTTTYPHIMIGCGKNGAIYVIDRDNMGQFNSSGDSQIIQELLNVIGGTVVNSHSSTYVENCFSSPAYWQGHVYWGGINDSIKLFNFANGLISTPVSSQSSEVYAFPGASPIVSANGSSQGIVWTIENNNPQPPDTSGTAILHAYNANNLTAELYNSAQVSSDAAGAAVKFAIPVVANGKVYVGTQSAVVVYGLRNLVPPVPTNVVASAGNGQVGLSWSASSGATSYNVGRSTTSGGPYTTIGSPTATTYTDTAVSNGTTYYYVVAAVNGAGTSANSSQVSATPQLAVPPVPTNVVASAGNGQVGLSWSASSGATSYNVGRSTTSGGPYTTIGSPTATTYTDTAVSNGTTYYYVVAAVNGAGTSANSSQVSATPATITTVINYGGGFSSSGLQLNGNAALNGTNLELTNGGAYEASSAYYTTAVNVQSFTTAFSIQLTNANADGMAFVIQNTGLSALGPDGGGLGYGPDSPGGTGGIGKSVAVKFDLYSNEGEGTNSTGLYTNGASPTIPATTLGGGVNLHSGDVLNVQTTYNGTTLTMTITDASVPADTYTTSWPVNIPSLAGGNTAYVGFTAGTGGLSATQQVLNWTYSTGSGTTPPGTDECGGECGERTGGVELECVEWGNEL